jgi:hypothetical protein
MHAWLFIGAHEGEHNWLGIGTSMEGDGIVFHSIYANALHGLGALRPRHDAGTARCVLIFRIARATCTTHDVVARTRQTSVRSQHVLCTSLVHL